MTEHKGTGGYIERILSARFELDLQWLNVFLSLIKLTIFTHRSKSTLFLLRLYKVAISLECKPNSKEAFTVKFLASFLLKTVTIKEPSPSVIHSYTVIVKE